MVTDGEVGKPDYKREELLLAIADRVKRIRIAKGLTQKDVADAAGLTPGYIYLVEGGGQNITVTVFRRLAEGLGVSFDELLLGAEAGLGPSDQSIGNLSRILQKVLDALDARRAQDAEMWKTLLNALDARRAQDAELSNEIARIVAAHQSFVEFFTERRAGREEDRSRESSGS